MGTADTHAGPERESPDSHAKEESKHGDLRRVSLASFSGTTWSFALPVLLLKFELATSPLLYQSYCYD